MAFDFSIESLQTLQESLMEQGKEQQEAQMAERAAEEEAIRITESAMRLQREQSAFDARNATEVSDVLREMEATTNRIREINDSPMLRVVEPIAGFFDADFSREKLADRLQTHNTDLTLHEAQRQQQTRITQNKRSELEAQLKHTKAKTAAERGDAIGAAERVLFQVESAETMATAQAAALKNAADATEIGGLVEQGIVSKRAAEVEMRLRKDEKYTEQLRVYQMNRAQHDDQALRMESATAAQLRDPKWLEQNGISAPRAQRELDRQASYQMSLNNLKTQSEQLARNEALTTLDDKGLKTIADGTEKNPLVPKHLAAEELEIRKEAKGDRNAKVARNNATIIAAQEQALQAAARTTPLGNLRDMASKAEGGIVNFTDAKGNVLGKLPLGDVNKLIEERSTAVMQESDNYARNRMVEAETEVVTTQLERHLGLPPGEGATISDRMRTMIHNSNLDMDAISTAEHALANFETAEKAIDAELAAEYRAKGAAALNEMNKQIFERKTAGMTADRKAAYGRFANSRNGQVTQEDAVAIGLPAVLTNERTDSGGYNAAISHWRNEGLKDVNTTDMDGDAILAALTEKSTTVDAKLLSAGVSPAVQETMARAVLQEVVAEAHAATAEELGLTVVANAIRVGAPQFRADGAEDSGFSEAKLMQYIEEQSQSNITAEQYIRELARVSRDTIRQVTAPTGRSAELKAAVNALAFGNNHTAVLSNTILQRSRIGANEVAQAAGRLQSAAIPGTIGSQKIDFGGVGAALKKIQPHRVNGPFGIGSDR